MRSCARAVMTSAIVLLASSVPAAELAALFSHRAEIRTSGDGLCRLRLTPDVLAHCRSDLADLRIVAADGSEVPYLIDSPELDQPVRAELTAVPKVVSVERSTRRIDPASVRFRETIRLRMPDLPPGTSFWTLSLDCALEEFVAAIDVRALNEAGEKHTVTTDETVFRLPSAQAARLEIAVNEPRVQLLEIVLEGENQGYLQPRFTAHAVRDLAQFHGTNAELAILSRSDRPGKTELVVNRPRGLMPRHLKVHTSTTTFRRRVVVWDEGAGAAADALATTDIFRIAAATPVEKTRLPLAAATGDRLRIQIENRDSPPLEGLRIEAVIVAPHVLFDPPDDGAGTWLLFGGGRAGRPQYDLLALEGRSSLPSSGSPARRILAIVDPSQAVDASLGPIEANPIFTTEPALSFAMHAAATIDRRLFSHRREVHIASSPEGLSRIELEASDLALLEHDLRDVRLVDTEDRQWAYILQRRSRPEPVTLNLVERRRDQQRSRYLLDIPDAPLAVVGLEVQTPEAFFNRSFRLVAILPNGLKSELARGSFSRRPGDPRPVGITCQETRAERLVLEITDGNDAPLRLSHISAWYSPRELYVAARPGSYDLLLGNPLAEAPAYELERARSTVLAVPTTAATVGPIESNPAFAAGRRLTATAQTQKGILWVCLGLAACVLVWLSLRAARQGT